MTILLQTMSHTRRLLVSVMAVLLMVGCSSSRPAAQPAAPTQAAATPVPTPGLVPGKEARVSADGARQVFAATTSQSYDELATARRLDDRLGMENLVRAGRVVLLDVDTRILVLEGFEFLASLMRLGFDGELVQVRVLEGRHVGRGLWLPVEQVRQ